MIDLATTEAYVAVLRGDICSYCGSDASSIDHIEALSAGGEHAWDNLTSACRHCNSSKYDAPLLRFLLRSY